jgi:hypothetical protein
MNFQFTELKESLNQSIEHPNGERNDLRDTVLSDNARFVVNREQWQKFDEKLNVAVRDLPALRKLLNDSGVFDDGK